MSYIDGNGNAVSVDTVVHGVPWLTYNGIVSRLNTDLGAQVMRPDYGINLAPYIDKPVDLTLIRLLVERSMEGLEGLIGVIVTQPDPLSALVQIEVKGETTPLDTGSRPWSAAFSLDFG